MSLRLVAAKILEGGADTLLAAARHPQLRRVVTVCLAARGGPFRTPPPPATTVAWLVAVEAADAKELVCADLLAWVAYQAGDFESSGRWLQRAPRESAGGAWLQAKLLLRDGKVEDAAAALAQAVRHFPQSQDWPNATKRHVDCNWRDVPPLDQARGELAVLQLNRGECRDALDLLLRAGYWTDAAYVAERVLSVDELVAYAEGVTDEKLRHLLARRLARLGRYDEARRFLPEPLRPKLAELVAGLLQRDAAGLWQAARILRWHGMELVGTELSPDWFLWGGSYDWGFDGEGRLAPVAEDVQPVLRFHYRYCAAELAWEAATMMPDNSEATARVLCEAGTWLKNRDPQAADRFYKALVLRCRKTDLGQEADRLRWFPKLPPTAMP
jgi:tetratricopeptide (TPR) repeat protein